MDRWIASGTWKACPTSLHLETPAQKWSVLGSWRCHGFRILYCSVCRLLGCLAPFNVWFNWCGGIKGMDVFYPVARNHPRLLLLVGIIVHKGANGGRGSCLPHWPLHFGEHPQQPLISFFAFSSEIVEGFWLVNQLLWRLLLTLPESVAWKSIPGTWVTAPGSCVDVYVTCTPMVMHSGNL